MKSILRVIVVACAALALSAAQSTPPPSELIGTWRGTSTCSDREAAPAWKDKVVIYDFTPGEAAGSVHWKADKVVNGQRRTMGEFDVVYNPSESCWRADLQTPQFNMVWRVSVNGKQLTGSAMLLPGKQVVRKIEARKD